MSAPKAKDPLDALQSLVNDVLVQTGKALRASRKDSQGNLAQAPGTMQSKLPETIRLFHCALDELEYDIIGAKSVLLRDINKLQEKKKKLFAQPEPQPEPQPVEAQTKHPMTIDLDSSPSSANKDHPMADDPSRKPIAPFPNMSIDPSDSNQMDISMDDANSQPQPPPPGGMDGGPVAQMSEPSQPVMEMKLDGSGMSGTSGMNFTDMEFTLAPPGGSEPQGQPAGTTEPSFDLTTFAPADGGDDVLNLNLLSNDQNSAPASGTVPQGTQPNTNQEKAEEKKEEPVANFSVNTEFFGPDSGAADGMDFDFSLGGSGDDTFDDLMNNRDSTFELMDAGGDFDTAFFGLDKNDET